MTSAIVSATIDADFPVAGQDNDSQGFRDNFRIIKDGLATATSEITVLQNTTAQGAEYDAELDQNDFGGSTRIVNAITNRLQGLVYSQEGTILTGSGNINYEDGEYHIVTIGNNTVLTFTNWPGDASTNRVYAKIKVELRRGGAGDIVVTLASQGGGTLKFVGDIANGFPLPADESSAVLLDVWTTTGGDVVYISPAGESGTEFTIGDLNDIANVVITGTPTNGQVLKYDTATSKWINAADANTITNIDDIGDVVITGTPTNGQVLKYDTATSKWVNGTDALGDSLTLDNLTDVVITGTPTNGQVLKYNGTNWVNGTDNVDNNLVTYLTKIVDDGSGTQDVFELNGTKLKTSAGIKMDFGFAVGNTYRFDLSDASNTLAPLRFSTTPDTAMPASVTPYTTGVTIVGTAGTANAYVEILISNATPSLFLYSDETSIDTSLIGAALEIPNVRNQQYAGSEDLATATAASTVKSVSYFTTAAAETATLDVGTDGQIKTFAMVSASGNMVITVTNPGWGGAGTITFSATGQACTLQYINDKWFCIGNNGAAFA